MPIRLVADGGNQVEQPRADAERRVAWDPVPELLEGASKKRKRSVRSACR